MYHVIALICALIAIIQTPYGIGDKPLYSLTLREVFHDLQIFGFIIASIYFLFQSLVRDKIWFWRWKPPFVFDVIIALTPMIFLYKYLDTSHGDNDRSLTYALIDITIYIWALTYQPIRRLYVEAAVKTACVCDPDFSERVTDFGKENFLKEFINSYIDTHVKLPVGRFNVDFYDEKTDVEFRKISIKEILRLIRSNELF